MKDPTIIFKMKALTATLLFSLLFYSPAKADIKTYNWQEDLKGFSIEAIPGTSPTEYIAVGSVFYNNTASATPTIAEGIHVMHLDFNGAVMCEKTFYQPNSGGDYNTLQAIDVAVENSNSFWITIQYRGAYQAPPFDRDLIFVCNIDANCNFLNPGVPQTPLVGISTDLATEFTHTNLVATSSVFHNGYLWVCGYITGLYMSYPIPLDYVGCPKVGMVLKLNVAGSGVSVAGSYLWNTPTTFSGWDYDAPLKLKVSNNTTILVTGGKNSGVITDESTILVMELNPATLAPIQQRGLVPAFVTASSGPPRGVYGVDIIQDNISGGYYVLANHEMAAINYKWSVSHINNTMAADPVPSMLHLNHNYVTGAYSENHWARMMFDDGTVLGEQMDLYCPGTVPSPHINTTSLNVNPFLDMATYSYNNVTGIAKTPSIHKLQMSINGTSGSFWVSSLYSLGSTVSYVDNIFRLYTSGIPYSNGGTTGFKILAPVSNNTTPYLNEKFITTDAAGDETQCNSTYNDCQTQFLTDYIYNEDNITQVLTHWPNGYYHYIRPTVDGDVVASESDCTAGNYKSGVTNRNKKEKPSTVASKGTIGSLHSDFIQVYPNPAKDVTNVLLNLQSNTTVGIQIVDALGRIVANIAEQQYPQGQQKISLYTTPLSAGIYTIKLQTSNGLFTQQLAIAK